MNTQSLFTDIEAIVGRLSEANRKHDAEYPGESTARQPIHTVYGGAHLFKAETAATLGSVAQRTLRTYAPDFASLARLVGLPGAETLPDDAESQAKLQRELQRDPKHVRRTQPHLWPHAWLAHAVYERVSAKLQREPVEDFRIDFEDGYGTRPDAEEDAHAVETARQVARGRGVPLFPPFIGIRIKPFTEALRARAMRTLGLFLQTLLAETNGSVPPGFIVTLPKVTIPAQVEALAELLGRAEAAHHLAPRSLRLELMIETPQSIICAGGRLAIPALVRAAGGRCRGLHFGVYDYTAACNITAEYQTLDHPVADFARHVMQVCAAGRGLELSDGATNILPVGPHPESADGPPLTPQQREENRTVVHRAIRLHFQHVQRSLRHAFYQGWDLHPAQLPTRYAAVYAFFLQGFDSAAARLRNFIERAAKATLMGDIFDDAATGQGLLNFFLRASNCGAITEAEALSTGLTLEELRGRSFLQILNNRRGN
ncbi:MAG TPA: phosphoenolpyruvate kinase [Terriglobia bacterium]|nr:phosphoenolpyruvate kinase [Terriglobia bacterium]